MYTIDNYSHEYQTKRIMDLDKILLSLVTALFFQTTVPLSQFLDLHFAGSQSPIGHMPSLPSHQDFAEGLNLGHAMAHRNITFVIWDLCLMQCFGFFSSGRRRYLSFSWLRKNHFSSQWI